MQLLSQQLIRSLSHLLFYEELSKKKKFKKYEIPKDLVFRRGVNAITGYRMTIVANKIKSKDSSKLGL